jgi:hypothetical protein
MDQNLLIAILGLYGGLLALGWLLYSGFKKNSDSDALIAQRLAMQMSESSGLMKEMARKTDEMARKTDEIAQQNKDNAIFLRMIFERVDKNR